MNIVFIHPYIKVRDVATYLSEPLGLLCLGTYLENEFKDVHVTILDLYALGAKNPQKRGDLFCLGIDNENIIQQKITELKPDLIGLPCNFTAYMNDTFELAELIKRNFPSIPIVVGGAHPTIEAESTLTLCPSIDYVIRGEGELILANLIRFLKREISCEDVHGLVYRSNEKIIFNNSQELIPDISILPMPDRKFIDMEAYKFFNKETIWYVKNEPVATIMTSRGCPYSCVFCSTKVVWQRKWRPRNLELVFEEIEMLATNYGIKEFVINDDQFMTSRDRTYRFCDYFANRPQKLSFCIDSGVSPWLIDKELLKKMKQAGFYSLRFPIETGNEKTLKYITKPVKLKETKQLINDANRLGFWTSSNIIVGFPYETKEEALESIQYAYDSALDFTSFIIAKPNAGSAMYEDFKKHGLLETTVVRGSDFYRSDYDTLHITAKELNVIVHKASAKWFLHKIKFYMNPQNFYKHFYPKIRTFEDFSYFLKIFRVILKNKVKPIILNLIKETFLSGPSTTPQLDVVRENVNNKTISNLKNHHIDD